jgi:hypothetical protein
MKRRVLIAWAGAGVVVAVGVAVLGMARRSPSHAGSPGPADSPGSAATGKQVQDPDQVARYWEGVDLKEVPPVAQPVLGADPLRHK